MSRAQAMIAWLQATFESSRQVDRCLDRSSEEEMFIGEENGDDIPCIFRQGNNDGFQIRNTIRQEIHLLATDHCFFTSVDEKRCDCIVFDDHDCCFIELKLNVQKWKKFADNAQEAKKQLGNTIRFFEAANEVNPQEFFGFKREAYIVMRDNIYPKSIAARNESRVRFLQEYKVPLFEQNKKSF